LLSDLKNLIERYRQRKAETDAIMAKEEMGFRDFTQSSPIRKNNVIAICNQKGGCAKTTTAINLSSCIAAKGHSVLLIDLDPQAHASLGLGIDIENAERTIYDVLINNAGLDSVIHKTSVNNLDIIPANSILSGAQLELADMLGREIVLRIALRKLKLLRGYDFIFLDCSPSLNLITINALAASSSVIIPIQTHYYSLEGMKELFSTIDIVKDRLNSELEILGILATLFDVRTRLNHEMLEQIRRYFKDMVFKTSIRNNVRLSEAPIYKKPIHIYDPKSQGAKDYWDLAEEVLVLTGCAGQVITVPGPIQQTQELNVGREPAA
jgi:chromosome partitioning protein